MLINVNYVTSVQDNNQTIVFTYQVIQRRWRLELIM